MSDDRELSNGAAMFIPVASHHALRGRDAQLAYFRDGFDCQYVSTRTSLRIFFLLKYNNSNSSTGECVWINGEQNSQRQESVQQH